MVSQNRPESLFGLPRIAKPSVLASVVALAVVLAFSSVAKADGTKPFRAARLTYIDGEVHVEQANSKAESTAVLNMPLVEGTVISAGDSGKAEIEFEDGSLVRLTPNTGLSLANLSVDSSGIYQTRMALLGGLAFVELRAGTKYQFSLDAGGDVISPTENATVRVNLDEAPAIIAVLDGSVHIASANGSTVDATAGQTVRADAQSEGGVYMIKQAIAPESWDQWNEDRDEGAASEAGLQTDARTKFAGDQGYGWSDLDANGSWYDVPGHGEVWQPGIAAQGDGDIAGGDQSSDQGAGDGDGFDPYSYGSWVYTPAGYTWASGYGWGWLPYRCGTWSYWNGFGWGWTPGYGCGVYGGYFYGVNIGSGPGIYHRPRRPIAGPNPVHPILRGRGIAPPSRSGPSIITPIHAVSEERTIAGNVVTPLRPIGGGYTPRGGSAIGWGLRKDYPVDKSTHEAVSGIVASHSLPVTGSSLRAAWQPAGASNGQPVAQRPAYSSPRGNYPSRENYSNQANQARQPNQPVSRQAPVTRQYSAPPRQSAPAPAQRSAPASAPASRSAPAATSSSSSHPH